MVYSFCGTLYSIKNKLQLHVTPWMHLRNKGQWEESYRRTDFIYITPNKQKAKQYRFRDREIYMIKLWRKSKRIIWQKSMVIYSSLRKHRWWWQWAMHQGASKAMVLALHLSGRDAKEIADFSLSTTLRILNSFSVVWQATKYKRECYLNSP